MEIPGLIPEVGWLLPSLAQKPKKDLRLVR
jgi:hypothetical protein